MTSELRVDNLKGSTTGGSINVLGEGTSATTNLQQGLAKVYVEGSTDVALNKSFNISTGTDHDTGDYSYALISPMDSANYSQPTSVVSGTNDRTARRNSARDAAGTMAIETSNARTNSATDQVHTATLHGDLA